MKRRAEQPKRDLLRDDVAQGAYARARGETTKGARKLPQYPNVNSQESGGNRYK